jgi:hypothetical protein
MFAKINWGGVFYPLLLLNFALQKNIKRERL